MSDFKELYRGRKEMFGNLILASLGVLISSISKFIEFLLGSDLITRKTHPKQFPITG